MSSEIVKQFNEILSSFLLQITPYVGGKYHKRYNILIRLNSTSGIEKFLVRVLPVRDKIINRDESYFTKKAKAEDFDNDMEQIDEIVGLQGVYHTFDEKSKKNVWDIFQALLILGEDYIRVRNTSSPITMTIKNA